MSLLAISCAADSADEEPDLDELMLQVDTDKDGKLSWEEMMSVFEGPEQVEEQYKIAFDECDEDKDGLINREELPQLFGMLTAILQMEDQKMGADEIDRLNKKMEDQMQERKEL